ncbi:MAG TPA: hypothetical protein VH589_07440 [Trebonia sp.]
MTHRPGWMAAVSLTALITAGCASGSGSGISGVTAPHASARTTAPKSVPYNLYTHCGIAYARVGNRYYQANVPLSDGSGNPPSGWGNPYQPGTLTFISPTRVIFTDKAGHRVVFTLVASGGHGRTTESVCA